MLVKTLSLTVLLASAVDACDRSVYRHSKRAAPGPATPIDINPEQGLATTHRPTFGNYGNVSGEYNNWNHGPAFELIGKDCDSDSCPVDLDAPNITFDDNGSNDTAYLTSWHVHTPSEHTYSGHKAKAELHLVHVDAEGDPRAVVAIRIDVAAAAYSTFFSQLPLPSSGKQHQATNFPDFNHTSVRISGESNVQQALAEVNNLSPMTTYRGSLTTPPCKEGIRFFVASHVLYVSTEQLQDILRVSTFCTREVQQVWAHDVNV